MTSDIQKEIEMFFAKNAADSLGEAWDIRQSPNERRWPDLLVAFKGEEFGLEIREIYPDESRKGSKKRAVETFNFQNLNAIAEKYYEFSEVTIKVNMLGSFENEGLILNALKSINSNLVDFEQVRLKPYGDCVLYVTKLPSNLGKFNRWIYVSDRVGWVGELSDDLIQEKVNEKSANLDRYTKNINDVRLLLVCNQAFNSGKFVYSQAGSIDHSGFKEIYFLSYPGSACKLSS